MDRQNRKNGGMALQQPSYLLIDGHQPEDGQLRPIFIQLYETLSASGARLQFLSLHDIKLGHCVGCFNCWLKTPGQCTQPDAGWEIVQAIMNCDGVVFFGRVQFGTYSSGLKRLIDRCLSPINLPYLKGSQHETHHQPRYESYPRLMVVGVQRTPDPDEAALFKLIVGRNAIQMHAPSHAVSVIATNETQQVLGREFEELLTRTDPLPRRESLKTYLADLDPFSARPATASTGRQALLLTGSPKGKPSTSAALGSYLMQRMERHNWQTETLKLSARLHQPDKQNELREAIEQSDLVVLAFPLYNDSLPYLVAYAMELVAAGTLMQARMQPRRLVAIVNNGFPEPHHNIPAIAVCRRFALGSGFDWQGGLVVGGGEALSAGQPLQEIKRILPPVRHIMRALDSTAAALAEGQAIPPQAARLISRNPLHPVPFSGYRWIFRRVAARRWEREAAENGLSPAMLRDRPCLSKRRME
jgi:multimeric flavodoxin WrbA